MATAAAWIFWIVIIGGFCWWAYGTDSGRKAMAEARVKRAQKKYPAPISAVGTKVEGAGLACPKCGGTQFKVQRKTSTKVAFGMASMLGNAKHVRCVTCGTRYLRG